MIEKNLCYHFIDETSKYLDTLPVVYIWNFGDSTSQKSWEADHCFNDVGNYHITLTMIDTVTNEKEEIATYELLLEQPVQPYITHADTIITGQKVVFDGQDSYFPNGTIKQFVWMFSDGYKYTGQTCERVFKKPGKYFVKLGFIAFDENNVEVKECSIKEFEVINN
jgi:PKD repeat protein